MANKPGAAASLRNVVFPKRETEKPQLLGSLELQKMLPWLKVLLEAHNSGKFIPSEIWSKNYKELSRAHRLLSNMGIKCEVRFSPLMGKERGS